jgi:CarD family transcriptional regulator
MSSKSSAPKKAGKAKTAAKPAVKGKKKAVAASRAAPKVVKKPAAKAKSAARPKAVARKPVAAAAKKPVRAAAQAHPRPATVTHAPKPAVAKPEAQAAKPTMAKAPAPKLVQAGPAAVAPVARPGMPKPAAAINVPAAPVAAPAKKPPVRPEFKAGEHIVYPAHGVGRITGIETQEVAGIKLDLFVVSFIKDKMTLRVPVPKASAVGMRKLADTSTVKRALETVRGRARIKRTMWSRRAQEYEAKINSGDLIAIAEVVRDLFRSENQPEQSYSERQLYEAALDRMSREISSVNRISETEAVRQIEQNLAKSPRRGMRTDGPAEAEQDQAA